jgi:rhodanese-related sulfurtransferase
MIKFKPLNYSNNMRRKNMVFDSVEEVTCTKFKEKLDNNETIILIDVREQTEYDICHIEGSKFIPLGELHEHYEKLDKSQSYVIHCKSGRRSAAAVKDMTKNGFQHVANLKGGILQWIIDIDSSLTTY